MTTIVDGTTGITFPSAIAGVSATQQYSGRLVQVVSTSNTTVTTMSSATFIATGMSASITPTSTSSKVLVTVHTSAGFPSSTTNPGIGLKIYRGSTMLTDGQNYMHFWGGSIPARTTASLQYLDSPASTSSVTYNLYASNYQANGTLNFNEGSSGTTITLMEITG